MHPDKVKQSLVASKTTATPNAKSGHKQKPGGHVIKRPSQNEIRDAIKMASDRTARLGLVANILRGPGRQRYDHFLSNGFPKWKGTGYYYARFRPGLSSVLAGLFVLGGGLAHYGAMYVSWKRQREFVERYIRHARRAAWGDEIGIKGVPRLDGTATAEVAPFQPDSAFAMNRRQKRMQEKESKKEKELKRARGSRRSGTSTPLETDSASGQQTERKRVQAENGKTLIVDSIGNVYLEEDNEDGESEEYLLDPDEIQKPTFRQTILVRLPVWAYTSLKDRSFGRSGRFQSDEVDVDEQQTSANDSGVDCKISDGKAVTTEQARKRGKRNGKAR
ncbi:DnaJ sub C member 1 [Toensbergia leucococca]|nr:DnaJ sub C member 1 [Toensbergia leucococca]